MSRQARNAGVLAASAMGVGLGSAGGIGRRLDDELFRRLNAARGSAADRFFGVVTELGSILGSAGAAVALAVAGHRRTASRAFAAATAMWALGQIVKKAFRRARPYDASPDTTRLLIARPRGMSWPSSHPAVLIAFLTVIERDLGLDPPGRAALGGLTAAVAMSRVYLGVHYPSDVLGGLLLGRAVGLAWPGANEDPSVE